MKPGTKVYYRKDPLLYGELEVKRMRADGRVIVRSLGREELFSPTELMGAEALTAEDFLATVEA